MAKIFKTADELIGRTPLLELTHIEKEFELQAKLLAKLEYFTFPGQQKRREVRKYSQNLSISIPQEA